MKPELFDELLEGVRQGGEYLKGKRAASRKFEIPVPDVKAIRQTHHLSQADFAALIGIKTSTLKNWEQGRRKPEGAARRLLQVVAHDFDAVLRAVHPQLKDR